MEELVVSTWSRGILWGPVPLLPSGSGARSGFGLMDRPRGRSSSSDWSWVAIFSFAGENFGWVCGWVCFAYSRVGKIKLRKKCKEV